MPSSAAGCGIPARPLRHQTGSWAAAPNHHGALLQAEVKGRARWEVVAPPTARLLRSLLPTVLVLLSNLQCFISAEQPSMLNPPSTCCHRSQRRLRRPQQQQQQRRRSLLLWPLPATSLHRQPSWRRRQPRRGLQRRQRRRRRQPGLLRRQQRPGQQRRRRPLQPQQKPLQQRRRRRRQRLLWILPPTTPPQWMGSASGPWQAAAATRQSLLGVPPACHPAPL